VDAETVVIRVNNQTIYQGGSETYTSAYGRCGRSGTKSDYQFVYQPYVPFDFDEVVTVSVNAADLEGNVMTPHSYSFVTEMRAFGNNPPRAVRPRPATPPETSGRPGMRAPKATGTSMSAGSTQVQMHSAAPRD